MNFDKKFNKQTKLIQLILLLIPVVNVVTEILVRLSSVLRKQNGKSILGVVLAIFFPFFGWVDLVWVLLFGKLCLQ